MKFILRLNQTSILPLTGTEETPVGKFEENLRNQFSLKSHRDRDFDDLNAKK